MVGRSERRLGTTRIDDAGGASKCLIWAPVKFDTMTTAVVHHDDDTTRAVVATWMRFLHGSWVENAWLWF
jgi:hypothetical protein